MHSPFAGLQNITAGSVSAVTPNVQLCGDPAQMQCSSVQGKMQSPLFSATRADGGASLGGDAVPCSVSLSLALVPHLPISALAPLRFFAACPVLRLPQHLTERARLDTAVRLASGAESKRSEPSRRATEGRQGRLGEAAGALAGRWPPPPPSRSARPPSSLSNPHPHTSHRLQLASSSLVISCYLPLIACCTSLHLSLV